MKKRTLRTPFFVINPKAYLYGKQALALAKAADELSSLYDIDILFTVQQADVSLIKQATTHLFITVQHLDGIEIGRGMGYVLPEAVAEAGAEATFLNHAEHPMTLQELTKAMQRSNELGILTIVCANSLTEARAAASLKPDVMVCEPTELIGTGQTSDLQYMTETNRVVREIDPEILILQAAGISSAVDVEKALSSGADGTGGTSGIVQAEDPVQTLTEMIKQAVKYKKED